MLCYAILYYTILYCTVLYYTILYCSAWWHYRFGPIRIEQYHVLFLCDPSSYLHTGMRQDPSRLVRQKGLDWQHLFGRKQAFVLFLSWPVRWFYREISDVLVWALSLGERQLCPDPFIHGLHHKGMRIGLRWGSFMYADVLEEALGFTVWLPMQVAHAKGYSFRKAEHWNAHSYRKLVGLQAA